MRGGTSIIEKIGTIVLPMCTCRVSPEVVVVDFKSSKHIFFQVLLPKKMDEVLFQKLYWLMLKTNWLHFRLIIVINLLSRAKETPLTAWGTWYLVLGSDAQKPELGFRFLEANQGRWPFSFLSIYLHA